MPAGRRKRAAPTGAGFDPVFRILCMSAATMLLAAIAGLLVSLLIGGMPAFAKFGLGFFTSTVWNPSPKSTAARARSWARWSPPSSPC